MEHNYIVLDEQTGIKTLVLFQKDNNLDGKDNLDMLPELPAVYAVCGRVNGQPANPRYVGETDNLQAAVKKHFDKTHPGPDDCFREFMLSIKIKELVYELMPSSTPEERITRRQEWEAKYKPACNKELNEIH